MVKKTYTALITIDSDTQPHPMELAAMLAQYLEERRGYSSAQVDITYGDYVEATDRGDKFVDLCAMKRTHLRLRED